MNKEEISQYKKEYRKKHKEEMAEKAKEYYQKHKVKISEKNQENKEEIAEYQKKYRKENKEKRAECQKKYHKEHKEKILKQRYKHRKKRRKVDPCFRLREIVSNSINKALKRNNSSKNGISCLTYLPYSIPELKVHLESLFEPWMTNENQGIYKFKIWNDNNPTTWVWQIDHIIPHSTFKYESMDCEEFRACWALSNLRPFSAKQNWLDGINRTRHRKI